MTGLVKGNGGPPQRRYFGIVRMVLGSVATIALADGRTCGLPAEQGRSVFSPGTRVEVSLYSTGNGLRAFDPIAME